MNEGTWLVSRRHRLCLLTDDVHCALEDQPCPKASTVGKHEQELTLLPPPAWLRIRRNSNVMLRTVVVQLCPTDPNRALEGPRSGVRPRREGECFLDYVSLVWEDTDL